MVLEPRRTRFWRFCLPTLPYPLPPAKKQPTDQARALAALAFIKREVLIGFPFESDHDRSAALSAILTATVRHALRSAPMHTFNAPTMASGKSLLADVVAMVATGQPATVMSHTGDDDEMRKRFLSLLLQGDAPVNIDNIEEPLANQTLCGILTQETFTDRILGGNRTATAPTTCCWLATGNNLVIAGDLTARVVPCRLDPRVERPEERRFSRNLHEWIPENRPALVTAALTVLRAYIVAGTPEQPVSNFARFEDWSGRVRSALVWLGEPDPLEGRKAVEKEDPIRARLRALPLGWYRAFRTAEATAKEAIAATGTVLQGSGGGLGSRCPELQEALEDHFSDRTGTINATRIGHFLRDHAGRISDGAKFEQHGSTTRVKWRIVIENQHVFDSALNDARDPRETRTTDDPDRGEI